YVHPDVALEPQMLPSSGKSGASTQRRNPSIVVTKAGTRKVIDSSLINVIIKDNLPRVHDTLAAAPHQTAFLAGVSSPGWSWLRLPRVLKCVVTRAGEPDGRRPCLLKTGAGALFRHRTHETDAGLLVRRPAPNKGPGGSAGSFTRRRRPRYSSSR